MGFVTIRPWFRPLKSNPQRYAQNWQTPEHMASALMFSGELCFPTFDEAKAAEAELREAGFRTEILDEIDEYSTATFMNVSRAEGCFDQLEALVDPYNGFIIEAG